MFWGVTSFRRRLIALSINKIAIHERAHVSSFVLVKLLHYHARTYNTKKSAMCYLEIPIWDILLQELLFIKIFFVMRVRSASCFGREEYIKCNGSSRAIEDL